MKRIRTKHAQRPFTAHRDEHGVPHIAADNCADALYGLGFVHAMDRPTQMLFSRAVANGRTSELIADKPAMLETDRFFRKAGLYRNVAREVSQLAPEHLEDMVAYCHGVNAGMHQAGRSLPMWATGFRPHPWDVESVLLLANLLNYAGLAVVLQQQERLLVELIQARVNDANLRELFSPLLDNADFELLR